MKQKVIIIGATSGIGLELAKLYIQKGCRVGVTGRRGHLLEDLQGQFPSQVETECFDVMGENNIAHLESLIKKLDGLDLLIYNSGYGEVSETLDWAIDKRTTLTNVNGFIEIVNYAFNYFVSQRRGQIAATSSIAAVRENSHAPAYSASKAFLSTYLAGLYLKALRLRKKEPGIDIAISDIQPGFVKTNLAKGKGRFWEATVEKAGRQIFLAIEQKKRKTYITRRWVIVAWLLKILPHWLLRRFA